MKFIIAFGVICSFLLEINAAEFTDCGKTVITVKFVYGMMFNFLYTISACVNQTNKIYQNGWPLNLTKHIWSQSRVFLINDCMLNSNSNF